MKKEKRILIGVTYHTSLTFHENLARELKDRGHKVHLVSSSGPDHQRLSREFQTHTVKMVRNPSLIQDFRSLYEWIKLIGKIRPDMVLVGTPKASLLGMIAAKLGSVKHRIYWVHGLRLETTLGIKRVVFLSLERLTAALSTSMYSVSPSLKLKLMKLRVAPSSKIQILGKGSTQGVDINIFHPLHDEAQRKQLLSGFGLEPDKFTIGFVGRLTQEKGIIELEDALKGLQKESREFQLLILGSIEDETGAAFLAGLRESGISYVAMGHVEDSAPYYQVMSLFCLPTYREGLPNVILEAFASKVPVVSTKVTGVVDLIQDEKNGLLVPARDSESLKKAIIKIMDNGNLSKDLVDGAYSFVKANFDQRKVILDQSDLIEDLFGEEL